MPKADHVIGSRRKALVTGGGGINITRTKPVPKPKHEEMKAWGKRRGVDPHELIATVVSHLKNKSRLKKKRVASSSELVGVAKEYSGMGFDLQDFNKLLHYGVALGKLGLKKDRRKNVWHLPGEAP